MLQVATFALPAEQNKANEFLKTHKPQGNINFNKDTIVVFYEDDPAHELVDLLESVGRARFQQEVALHVAKSELAELNPTHNKGRFDELNAGINQIQDAIDTQDIKKAFLEQRIEALRKG